MYIEWDEKLATGLEIVDLQHRRLIRIINDLYADIGAARGEAALYKVFGELRRYADYHFGTEERLLKQHRLAPERVAGHLAEHEAYRRRVADLRLRHDEGERLVPVQVLAFVAEWWLNHIVVCDREFVTLADRDDLFAEDAAGEDSR
jgi:hemerythrin-like metal-binding protein